MMQKIFKSWPYLILSAFGLIWIGKEMIFYPHLINHKVIIAIGAMIFVYGIGNIVDSVVKYIEQKREKQKIIE